MALVKKETIEQKYITIVAFGCFYCNNSSDRAEDIVYLDEPYDTDKDYQTELQKAIEQHNSTRNWNKTPEIITYWKTIAEKNI